MANNFVAYISIGCNECIYNRRNCTYEVEKYIQNLKLTDHLSFDTSDYIYPIKMRIVDCNLMDYGKIIISLPVKPLKNIRIKIIING